ncbi:MAG: energy transducer TonB [Vicinamibacterales bacterium]
MSFTFPDVPRVAVILAVSAMLWVSPAAAQSAGEAGAVRVGGSVKPPTRTKVVKPEYPPNARQSRVQGVVILEVTIGTDGKVKATKTLKSVPQLDTAASDAVKKWEYQPTVIDGKPTTVIMTVPVNFTLD